MRLFPLSRVLRTASVAVPPVVLAALLGIACSAGSGDQSNGPGHNGQGANSGNHDGAGSASGSSGNNNDGSSTGTGGSAGIGLAESGVGGGSGGSIDDGADDPDCVGQLYPGDLASLAVYILLDATASMKSTGMDGEPPVWEPVITAIKNVVSDSATEGIKVGMTYLPVDPVAEITGTCKPVAQGGAGCPPGKGNCAAPFPLTGGMMGYVCDQMCTPATEDVDCGYYGPCENWPMNILGNGKKYCGGAWEPTDSCDPHDYGQPVVPIAELPGNKNAIIQAIDSKNANGGSTPSKPALEGTLWYARDWAIAHPDHIVSVLFATDGLPNNCTNNQVSDSADVAKAAAETYPFISTFVLGIGKYESLNAIAVGGGTEQAYFADGETVSDQLVSVFNDVRANGSCQFLIPQPEPGTGLLLDFDKVNVQYTPIGESEPVSVGYVNGEDECDPAKGGWYYDDSTKTNPGRVLLCPATCAEVRISPEGVGIQLGCRTRIKAAWPGE